MLRRSRSLAQALRPAALALLWLLVARAAGGDQDHTQVVSAYKGWTVSSLEIRGIDGGMAKEMSKGLELSGQPKFLGRKKASLYEQALSEDLRRARLFLAERGYPYADITPRFKGKREDKEVEVLLEVTPGPAVVVDSVGVAGVPPALEKKAHDRLAAKPGAVFAEKSVKKSVDAVRSVLRYAGHARAEVEAVIEKEDSTHVSVHINAEPGPVYRFEEMVVTGAPEDLAPLAKKTVDLKPGTLYSPAVVREAEDFLRLLNLFSRIRLGVVDAGAERINLQADLSRRSPWTFEANVGYWTDEQLKVRARWHHRNLFQRGRGIEIRSAYSQFEQTGSVSLSWPGFFGPRTWGLAGVSIESEREDSYNLLSTGLDLTGTYRPTLLTSLSAGLSVSNVDVDVRTDEPDAFIEQGGLLTVISLDLIKDSSDDRLFPSRGTVTRLLLEWGPPGFLSGTHYASLQGSAVLYTPLGNDVVLASRIKSGVAAPLGDSEDLLPNKRFYSGGATSMRGFKRRKLGPLDEGEAPLGGASMLEASMELRFPILWRFGGALFVDTGQVWPEGQFYELDRTEVAVGPGLMIRTPIGPIRADWGYRLTDLEETQPKSVLHLSIGHPY